ncbi:MAG: SurA N-terminal domain-containing protein [Nitrospirae bacterium]|nr:SurA N-terminal domain-containing protein [Nitrospirota bacterium]
MIKLLRERMQGVLVATLWIVIIAFIGTIFLVWGRGTVNPTGSNVIATVDGEVIPFDEYKKAYFRAVDTYKKILKDKYSDEMIEKMNLKKMVIGSLIEERIILSAASRMGLMVSNEELLEVLSNIPAFQKDGKFDPVQYKKVLEVNKLPAKVFENNMKEDILKEKARRMIKESVVLSEGEGEMQKPPAKEGNVDMFLMQKQERAYMAYVDALKKRAKIKVYEDKL